MTPSIGVIGGCFRELPKHPRAPEPKSGDLVQVTWIDDTTEMAVGAARHVIELLDHKPDAAIALPTGNTPIGLYRRLAELHDKGQFSCPRARFFNLDEFVGLSAEDPQ